MNNHHGQAHVEGRSLALAIARGMHGASVHFDDVPHDRQSDTQSGGLTRGARVGLSKTVKDMRQEFGTDAHARVADDDLDVGIDPFNPYLYPTILRRELDGVGQQIPKNLLQSIGIAVDASNVWIDQRQYSDALRVRRWSHGRDGVMHHDGQLYGLDIEPELAGHDSGDVEYVLDNLRE